MLKKILTITRKELYTFYTDRNLLIVMLAAPLAIATIIGLAFGGMGTTPIQDIPIALVNLDAGDSQTNFGNIYASILVPTSAADAAALPAPAADCPNAPNAPSADANALDTLFNAVILTDADAARQAVDAGTYTAAVIIPPDFTQKLGYGLNNPVEAAQVEVYANAGKAISAGVVRSVIQGVGLQLAAGSISLATTLETTGEQLGMLRLPTLANSAVFVNNVACAFQNSAQAIRVEQQTVAGQSSSSTVAILVWAGSAQAMFFMLFTGQGGVLDVFEERKNGTLQRMLISPTPRLAVLIGKVSGTFVTCLVQLCALFTFLTLVASVLSGQLVFIWGQQFGLLVIVMLVAALAATGVGVLIVGLARTPEQAGIAGQLFNFAMALLGGAFGFQVPEALSKFSLIYWGTNAFQKLAANQTDIALNVLILLVFGAGLFSLGFWLFARRGDL